MVFDQAAGVLVGIHAEHPAAVGSPERIVIARKGKRNNASLLDFFAGGKQFVPGLRNALDPSFAKQGLVVKPENLNILEIQRVDLGVGIDGLHGFEVYRLAPGLAANVGVGLIEVRREIEELAFV